MTHNPDFKVTPIHDVEYGINGTTDKLLVRTYTRRAHRCNFVWPCNILVHKQAVIDGAAYAHKLNPLCAMRYIRDMITALVRCGVGCTMGNQFTNVLAYADDLVLLAPSWKALQFLSASLYVSKRGAYWDRLCRDVVGRWSLVVTRVHCGQTVHPRPIVTMEH